MGTAVGRGVEVGCRLLAHSKLGELALKRRVKPQHNVVLRHAAIDQCVSDAALGAVVLYSDFAVFDIETDRQ